MKEDDQMGQVENRSTVNLIVTLNTNGFHISK